MRQKSATPNSPSERLVKSIRRATRKQYSAEEKIRIVLDGLRGESPQATFDLGAALKSSRIGRDRRDEPAQQFRVALDRADRGSDCAPDPTDRFDVDRSRRRRRATGVEREDDEVLASGLSHRCLGRRQTNAGDGVKALRCLEIHGHAAASPDCGWDG